MVPFWKLFLITIFENTVNTILLLFENCSYSLNLVFFVFFFFLKKKTIVFFVFFFFFEKKLE